MSCEINQRDQYPNRCFIGLFYGAVLWGCSMGLFYGAVLYVTNPKFPIREPRTAILQSDRGEIP
jgi:hypothetical protein